MKYVSCDRSGGDPVPLVEYEDDEDHELPLNWSEVKVTYRTANPDYAPTLNRLQQLERALQTAAAAAQEAGETEPTPEFTALVAEFEALQEDFGDMAETVTVSNTYHIAPPSTPKLLKFLGVTT